MKIKTVLSTLRVSLRSGGNLGWVITCSSKKFLLVWDKVLLVYTGKMLVLQTSDKSCMKENDKRECLCAHTTELCMLQCRAVNIAFQVSIYIFWMSNKVKGFMGRGYKSLTQLLLRGNSGYYKIICFWNIYDIFHGQLNIFLTLNILSTPSLHADWEV